MERLIAPKGIKTGIFRCLKAGVNPEFPEQGTPQGGVVSPLLANIALNGIEEIHPSTRYADDLVMILKPKDDANAILDKISQFLALRGMKVSEKKTNLTATGADAKNIGSLNTQQIHFHTNRHPAEGCQYFLRQYSTTDGFDFLGWVRLVLASGKAKSPK